ncbi:MAG: threonine/serine exporter ThrE family protein [Actinomycetes bacterium]
MPGPPKPQYPRFADRARRAIAGQNPPTLQIGLRTRRSELDDLSAHAALELALRIGEAMLAVGVPAADVTATVLRVAAAYGMTSCQVDVTYTSLTVSWDRDDAVPLTGMRIVRVRTTDYSRLHGVTDLAHRVAKGGVDVEEAHRVLDEVLATPHPYRRWVVTLFLGLAAAAVGLLLGGGPVVAVVAGLTSAGIDLLMRTLTRWGLPQFFQQAACAMLATVVAVALVVLETDVRTSLVVGAGIVVLLMGMSLVGAAEDAISGFHVTAAARSFEVMTLTAGIVVGIALVLDVARRAGVPLVVLDPTAYAVPPGLQLAAAAGISAFFAIASYARPRPALVAGLAGAASWAVFSLGRELGLGAAVASAVAAVVVGFSGDVVTQRLRIPPLIVAASAVGPLLPGLTIYRGLFAIVVDADVDRGVAQLATAGAIGLGLAAGVTFGEFLATGVRTELDRWDRKVRRRATGAVD